MSDPTPAPTGDPTPVQDRGHAPAPATGYVRYQGTVPHARGHLPGVFALVNGLARDGELSPGQEKFRRANNDWYDAAYPEPSSVDPTVYDHAVNPGAVAWFKTGATELIERVPGYLEILHAHEVECVEVRAESAPGRIVYEDEWQIVVVPYPAASLPVDGGTTSVQLGRD